MPKFEDRELVRRWRSESPRLFKRITNVMITIGGVSAAVLTITATLPISLPAIIVTGATYGVVAGTVGATISKLTKK